MDPGVVDFPKWHRTSGLGFAEFTRLCSGGNTCRDWSDRQLDRMDVSGVDWRRVRPAEVSSHTFLSLMKCKITQ